MTDMGVGTSAWLGFLKINRLRILATLPNHGGYTLACCTRRPSECGWEGLGATRVRPGPWAGLSRDPQPSNLFIQTIAG